jgi:hypothetical protein
MRPGWAVSLLVVSLLGGGCERNCAVGNSRLDAGVDGQPRNDAHLDGVDRSRVDASPVVGWAIAAGGAGEEDFPWRMVLDPAGDLVLAGDIGKTAAFGTLTVTSARDSGGNFVAKINPSGKFRWAVPLDGARGDICGLAVDSGGNIYFAGGFTGTATFGSTTLISQGDEDGLLLKLDPTGKVLWARAVATGPLHDHLNDLAIGSDGKLTVGGHFEGTATVAGTSLTAKGASDVFVARLDPDGGPIWVKQAGGDGDDWLGHLVVDAAGRTFAAGSVSANASFGSLTLAGTAGSTTAYVVRVGPDGTFEKVFAPSGNGAGAIQVDSAGTVYVVTAYRVPWTDAWAQASLTKISADGSVAWAKTFAGTCGAVIYGLLVSADGSVTLGGFFQGSIMLDTTVLQSLPSCWNNYGFLARLDSSGAVVRAERLGGNANAPGEAEPSVSTVVALTRDSARNLYVAGSYTYFPIVLGGTTLPQPEIDPGKYSSFADIYVWNKGPDQL